MTSWELVILLSKALSYVAMLAIPGTLMIRFLLLRADPQLERKANRLFLQHLLSWYLFPATMLGVLSVSLFFLAQVGAVNQQGVAGMFDRNMAAIMADTALGDGVQWRLNGFMVSALALVLMYLALKLPKSGWQFERLAWVFVILAGVLFAWSFAVLGHASVLGLDMRAAVALHLFSVGIWVGALIPLYLLCCSHGGSAEIERRDLSRVMEDFGKAGWGFITAMLVSGGYLLFGLLDAPADLWTSAYGRLLSAKLILVATLMATGTCNKFRLVPALRDPALFPANLVRLRRSIQMEMGLAAVVLLLAATFTTVFGPAS